MKNLRITCDDKLVIRVNLDKETWLVKSCFVSIGDLSIPDFTNKHYAEFALWLQQSKFKKIVHETICAYCGDSGVVEIERCEGLFNCPECHPDKP